MNSLVRASVRAAVSGVPDFGPACPFCGARDAQTPATATSGQPGPPHCHRCRECAAFLRNAPAEAIAPAFESAPRDPKYLQARASWIRDHLGYAPRRILDVGCREGEFLAAWPWTLRRDGIESDADRAQIAAEAGLRVFNGPIAEADPGQEYDVVTWYGGPELGLELRTTLRRVTSWVAAGGILALGIPTLECRRHRFGEAGRDGNWPEALAGVNAMPSHAWIEAAVEAHGFQLAAESWTSGGIDAGRDSGSLLARGAGRLRALLADRGPLTMSPTFDYYEALFRRI